MPAEAEPDGHGELAEHKCVGCVPVLAGVSHIGGLCCRGVHRMASWRSTGDPGLVRAASAVLSRGLAVGSSRRPFSNLLPGFTPPDRCFLPFPSVPGTQVRPGPLGAVQGQHVPPVQALLP